MLMLTLRELGSLQSTESGDIYKVEILKRNTEKLMTSSKVAENDELFMQFMSGEKQVIMTGEIAGVPFKVKHDSYLKGKAIVMEKVMAAIGKFEWVKDVGKVNFVEYWGYDIQGAIYQEVERQNSG